MQQVVPLEFLKPGETGRICEIDGQHELVARLAEMGFRQGVPIRMVRSGSPCIVAIENQRMSFRGDDAAAILVEID